MNFVTLKILHGWEVLWNRFYEETDMQYFNLSESCFGLLRMHSDYPDKSRDYWVIDVDRIGGRAEEGLFRLRVGINDTNRLLYTFETSDWAVMQEKINDCQINLIGQYETQAEEAQAALAEAPKPSRVQYPMMPFAVLSNWKVNCNIFCDTEFGSLNAEKWMFGTDLVFLQNAKANAEGDRYILSLDWKPNYDESGSYQIQVVANDYNEGVFHSFKSRDRFETAGLLLEYQDIINSFAQKEIIKQNLEEETELYQSLKKVQQMLCSYYFTEQSDERAASRYIKENTQDLSKSEDKQLVQAFRKVLEEGKGCISWRYLTMHSAGRSFETEEAAYGFLKEVFHQTMLDSAE